VELFPLLHICAAGLLRFLGDGYMGQLLKCCICRVFCIIMLDLRIFFGFAGFMEAL